MMDAKKFGITLLAAVPVAARVRDPVPAPVH